jgi:hypothetical protein
MAKNKINNITATLTYLPAGVPPSSAPNCSIDTDTYSVLSLFSGAMWPFDFCRCDQNWGGVRASKFQMRAVHQD